MRLLPRVRSNADIRSLLGEDVEEIRGDNMYHLKNRLINLYVSYCCRL